VVTTNARMFQRRRTAAQWVTDNLVLSVGEIGVESDTGLAKIGDGVTTWTGGLSYINPNLDIRRFGATASVARAGIQTALNLAGTAATAGQPITVYIPPGTWQLDNNGAGGGGQALVVPNNVTLRGAGTQSILRMNNSTEVGGGAVVTLEAVDALVASNITVEDLTVDGNQQGQTIANLRHGIQCATDITMKDLYLRNLVIRNCGHYGIGFQENAAVMENIVIENVYIENVRGDGIDIKGQATRGCHMRGVTVFYFGHDIDYPGQAGIDLRGTWTVQGVDIRSVDSNVHTDNAAIRFRQSGGAAGLPVRQGAVGCVVRGVTVALTGAVQANDVAEGQGAATNGYIATGNEIDTVAYRRANVVHVAYGGTTVDGTTSIQTTSVTPRPCVLQMVSVASSGPNAVQPTVTGCGLTWTLVRSRAHNANNRVSLFRAMGYFQTTPPTTGQLTIDFGGIGQNTIVWRWDEVENVSLRSDADAIVQTADNTVSAGGTTLAITLAAFNSTLNSPYAVFTTWDSTTVPDGAAGWHRSGGATAFDSRTLSTVWRPGSATTPTVTHAAASMTGVAAELRVARP